MATEQDIINRVATPEQVRSGQAGTPSTVLYMDGKKPVVAPASSMVSRAPANTPRVSTPAPKMPSQPVAVASTAGAPPPTSYLDPSIPNTPVAQVRPVESYNFQQMTETMQPEQAPIARPIWETEAEKYYKDLREQSSRPAEDIRREELSRVQAQIDAINQIYDQELARVKEEGAGRLRQTTSIAVGAGLAGSPFQQTQETKTQAFNQRQEQALQGERASKIAAILSGAEDKASDRYKEQQALARQGGIDYINFLKETAQSAKQDAIGTIAQLAKGGISLDEIPKERLRQIIQDSGYDDFTVRALYTSQTNQPTSFSTVGDKLVGYYFDPATQQIKTYESAPIAGLKSGVKYDMKTTPDGTVLMVPETIDPSKPLDEQIKVYGSQAQFAKPTGGTGGSGGSGTTGGTDPAIESWVSLIKSGQAKITSVPAELKNSVAQRLDTAGEKTNASQRAMEALSVINSLESNTAGLKDYAGVSFQKLFGAGKGDDGFWAGSPAADYAAEVSRLKSLLAIENLNVLKGLGAMSDREFRTVVEASTSLSPTMSESKFKQELSRIKQALSGASTIPTEMDTSQPGGQSFTVGSYIVEVE